MIPSAKTVALAKLPPTKRSYRPKSELAWDENAETSASLFTPGVGMWPPRRYTQRSPTVNRIRRFSSGMRNTFWKRSEEHTSELQSQSNLVCRLLLEKKKHN